MDFNPPSSGEIGYSNSYENTKKIRELELRVSQLEGIIYRLDEIISNKIAHSRGQKE